MSDRFTLSLVLMASAMLAQAAFAEDPPKTLVLASDEDSLLGDHLSFDVNVRAFKSRKAGDTKVYCAPKGATAIVTAVRSDDLVVRFKLPRTRRDSETGPERARMFSGTTDDALSKCKKVDSGSGKNDGDRVTDSDDYLVNNAELRTYSFRRRGFTFGGLAVPFKYYTGGDKRIVPSTTVAPFVGWRFPTRYGVTVAPLVSAGLGLIPITDPTTDQTETKSAFSVAIGFRFMSNKSERFNAGLLVGKDLLSRKDRNLDPTLDKTWISLYAGVAL